ncbi:hypothetical protein A3G06_00535 [Candidatus Nomurabacteria bacterium RIFCSPLOWO2_12_FULL_46_14]|uniref:Uncharacterized protein n=1 Tax=Candidatus Nomurabacteria bacterium RIFCSPLOWO2_12_FULL_46_14 TaxID=1801797 RepID=A0A1F6YC17_9BACT|nr:MAG: hypothetical protein A3G06_00535 [Candidatus Nomurabacteria bacterium RIFCSPLOWO2_12_FULL_46_14]
MFYDKKNRGISIIGLLLLGVLVIVVLGYFGVSLREVSQNPDVKDNLNYVEEESTGFWNTYLKRPASYLWNDVWVTLFWRPFIDNMQRIRDKLPTDIELNSPGVNI